MSFEYKQKAIDGKNPEIKRGGETVKSIRKNANQFTLKAPRLFLLLSSDH